MQKKLQYSFQSVAKGYTNLFRGTDQHLSKQKNVEKNVRMKGERAAFV